MTNNQLHLNQTVRNLGILAKVVAFHQITGDPILRPIWNDGITWLADAAKCEAVDETPAATYRHKPWPCTPQAVAVYAAPLRTSVSCGRIFSKVIKDWKDDNVKKLLTMLLSLALIFSVLSVGTAAQETDITGVWYGSVYGLMMTLTLDEAGEYTMEMAGEEPDTGTWQIDGDALKLDAGTEAELNFPYDGESIYADLGDGMEFSFNREPAAHFEPAAARTDAKLEELIGEWVCTLVSVFGMQMPPEIADMDLQLNIDGEAVTMSVSVMGEFTTAELQAVFADGTLTMVQTAQNITEDETVWIIQLLEDGTLSASSMMFEDPIVFYLEPAAE